MSDDAPVLPRCPWCSAELPTGTGTTCPACGASLTGADDAQVPGVTSVDAMAVIDAVRSPGRPRNRFVAWLSGAEPETAEPAPAGSVAPPSNDVRREMLRMQMAAELQELSSEAELRAAEEAIEAAERGRSADAAAAIEAAIETDQATDALADPAFASSEHGAPVASAEAPSADAAPIDPADPDPTSGA